MEQLEWHKFEGGGWKGGISLEIQSFAPKDLVWFAEAGVYLSLLYKSL